MVVKQGVLGVGAWWISICVKQSGGYWESGMVGRRMRARWGLLCQRVRRESEVRTALAGIMALGREFCVRGNGILKVKIRARTPGRAYRL